MSLNSSLIQKRQTSSGNQAFVLFDPSWWKEATDRDKSSQSVTHTEISLANVYSYNLAMYSATADKTRSFSRGLRKRCEDIEKSYEVRFRRKAAFHIWYQ